MRYTTFLAFALVCTQASSQIYRCEVDGKVTFTDEPCVGAKRIEVTPTRGLDSWSGKSRKGADVQREEFNRGIDLALRPVHGMSHEEMNVHRRRVGNHLTPKEHAECALLDGVLESLEKKEKATTGEGLAAVQNELYLKRKRYKALKC